MIRQLQTKWRRKFKADANPGDERHASIKVGEAEYFPDLVLTTEGGRKPSAVVEVETGESVNHLEAMSQWGNFARSRIPFYLFVPGGSLDAARRLVAAHQIDVTELWTYLVFGDQIRFTSVYRAPSAPDASIAVSEKAEPSATSAAKRRPRGERERAERGETARAEAVSRPEAEPARPAAAAAPASDQARAARARTDRPLADRPGADRPGAERPKREADRQERTRQERSRPHRKAAAPASPPRRKAAAPAKRAVASKRPARGVAKRAPVRRAAAAKSRPATKRSAQKRK